MDATTLTLAHQLERWLWQGWLEYVEECEADRKAGHRPHYCEHGTSNWTDYDNICGGCEDGRTMSDGVQRRETAIWMAKERVAQFHELMAAAESFRKAGIDFNRPTWGERIGQLLTAPAA